MLPTIMSIDCATPALLGLVVIYLVALAAYRLMLHPLSSIPGPSLAAISEWYMLRYHVLKGGSHASRIQELHSQYGPIIRLSPNEIHLSDPSFHDDLFNFQPQFDKPSYHIDNLQFTASTAKHKQRRRAIDSLFTRAAVQKLEQNIHSNTNKMCKSIVASGEKDGQSAANFAVLYRALSADIICEYALNANYEFLGDVENSHKFFTENSKFFGAMYLFRDIAVFGWMMRGMQWLPPKWLASGDGSLGVVEFQMMIMETIRKANSQTTSKPNQVRSVFQAYMDSSLPSSDKTQQAQLELAMLLVSAGFETSGNTLTTAHYHLLANKDKAIKLRDALDEAWPKEQTESPRWTDLEKIPYLRAVILEGLRLSLAAIGRLSRINQKEDLQFGGFTIPKGTIISMSHWNINFNEEIFPDARRFEPERWLQGEKSRSLERRFWPFSKGQRACLGLHLAWAEMYISLAVVFRNFDMELHDTTREDVDPKFDHFVPAPATSKGVRCKVKWRRM